MLIVKGKTQKSVLANILLDKTNSVCFQYYDSPVIWDSICVDSNEYSLCDFMECIAGEFQEVNDDNHYDYLIIYTNEYEEVLRDFIDWLDKSVCKYFCKDILVMCK
jgi:hypothetical protein